MILYNETITVTRPGAVTSYVNGYAQKAASTTFDILCSVQPATGRDLQMLELGERQRAPKIIFTPSTLLDGDLLDIDSENYKVKTKSDYLRAGFLQHTEVFALKVKES